MRLLLLATLLAALGPAGCGRSPTALPSPSPTPTPGPTYPPGWPNATAFQNLAHARNLERARFDLSELGPFLAVDSPEAVILGRKYGAQAFVDRFPESFVRMGYSFIGKVAICEMYFFVLSQPVCELGPIIVNAENGKLMYRDLKCLNALP